MYSKLGIKITNEQFDERIKNSLFIRVSDYINTKTPIKFKCKKCNKIFKKSPKEFFRLKCSCEKRYEEYKKILVEKNTELVDAYTNYKTKLLHKCKVCNNIFETSPKILKQSIHGCPFCAGVRMTQNDYINKIPSDIKLIGEFTNTYTKIKHQCLLCNNIWLSSPGNILYNNCGCPICSSSKGERIIKNYLNDHNISYIKEHSIKIDDIDYRFDFYLFKLNIFIEFDGIQHYKPVDYFGGKEAFLKNRTNDVIKSKWCMDNNSILIRIPYYEKVEEFLTKHLQKYSI